MGEVLGALYDELQTQLAFVHLGWNTYRALFADKETIDLLNCAASTHFWYQERMMWEATLLHLCRLTDKTRIAGKETLTLRRLASVIPDGPLRHKVNDLVNESLAKMKFARAFRDRRLAHTELPGVGKQSAESLTSGSRQQVEDALASMRAILNAVLWHYERTTFGYEHFEQGPGGVLCMLEHLKRGIEAQRQEFRNAGVPGY